MLIVAYLLVHAQLKPCYELSKEKLKRSDLENRIEQLKFAGEEEDDDKDYSR